MLEKKVELYEQGELVGELFANYNFTLLTKSAGIYIKNNHYWNIEKDIVNYIFLREKDSEVIQSGIEEWRNTKESLWGRRSHGRNCN